MASGTVKKIDENGFGFIAVEGGKDIFFHATGMAEKGTFDDLKVDDKVTYDLDTTGERPRAINVQSGD